MGVLSTEGKQLFLEAFLRGENIPSSFYLRLYNDTPVVGDSLSDLTGEPSGNGYSPIQVQVNTTDFPTSQADSDDWTVTTKALTFTASGGRIPAADSVTYAVLATTTDDSGKLVAYEALSEARYLNDGESLTLTFTIKLQ